MRHPLRLLALTLAVFGFAAAQDVTLDARPPAAAPGRLLAPPFFVFALFSLFFFHGLKTRGTNVHKSLIIFFMYVIY